MKLDAAFVHELAGLARLAPSPEEAARLAGELSRILDYVEQLQAAATDTPDEGGAVPRRPDQPVAPVGPELLAASAGRYGRFVRVPVVMGERE